MKTITLSIALMLCFIKVTSQNELVAYNTNNYNFESEQFYSQGKLKPVYFNFRHRKLRDVYKNEIQPLEFLHLCRSINDSAIQLQVARYDAFTRDKATLGVVALGGGFSAIGLLGSAAASSSSQGTDAVTGSLVLLGVVGVLAIPVAAIYSSVPHQKRKAVLFRDLPIAYNQFVESHQ